LTQFGYLIFCIIKYSGVPLPALHFNTVIRFSRTLVNTTGECYANEILQRCEKMYEIGVKKIAKTTTSYIVGLKVRTFSHKAHIPT